MKRVVLIFTLFLFTLSNAFHPESLDLTTRILNHYHHNLDHDHQLENTPSSDGSDSSNNLIPTETSTVPDHTGSYEIEFKEAVSTPEKVNPVRKINRFYFPVYRFNPVNCRHINRFVRHPNRIAGFDSVISYVLKNSDVARKFPRHHHDDDHHDDHEDDDHEVEIEEDDDEERENDMVKKRKEKHHHDHHHDDNEHDDQHDDDRKKRLVKDVLKKMRKEKHDDDDDHHHKVKLLLKKKRHDDEHDDDDDDDDEHDDDKVELKDVMKKIRKFMNFF